LFWICIFWCLFSTCASGTTMW